MWFMCMCTYLFVLKGLHQLRHPTESHGEGQMGASVAVGYLNAPVAKIPLPVDVTADFILTKDVTYQVSYIKGRQGQKGNWISAVRESHMTFQVSSDYLCVNNLVKPTSRESVLLSLLAGVKWSIKKPKKLQSCRKKKDQKMTKCKKK